MIDLRIMNIIFKENRTLSILVVISTFLFSTYKIILATLIEYNVNLIEAVHPFNILFLLLINISVLALVILINIVSSVCHVKFITQSRYSLQKKYFLSILEKNGENTTKTFFSNDIAVIVQDYLEVIISVTFFVFQIVLGIVYIWRLNLAFVIFLVITALLVLLLTTLVSKVLGARQIKYLASVGRLVALLEEIQSNRKIHNIFYMKKYYLQRCDSENKDNRNASYKIDINSKYAEIIGDAGSWIIMIGAYVLGIILIGHGRITIGQLFSAVFASSMITTPILWLSSTIRSLAKSEKVCQRYLDVVFRQEPRPETITLIEDDTAFKIKNVTFPFFQEKAAINIEINVGDRLLIKGKSGSGKSTLFSSVLGFSDEYSGSITVNTQNIQRVKTCIHHRVSYVPQIPLLMEDTVEKNIIGGLPYDAGKIDRVVAITELQDVYKRNHAFLEESIHQSFSEGEKQRIAIARALYKECDIIFLDEAFSAIEKELAKKIHHNIMESYKTVISIMHLYDQEIEEMYNKVAEI